MKYKCQANLTDLAEHQEECTRIAVKIEHAMYLAVPGGPSGPGAPGDLFGISGPSSICQVRVTQTIIAASPDTVLVQGPAFASTGSGHLRVVWPKLHERVVFGLLEMGVGPQGHPRL